MGDTRFRCDSELTFSRPAGDWLEALPLGNGRLGAMCWGGLRSVRFDLNDETVWSGNPAREAEQRQQDEATDRYFLEKARASIAADRLPEATESVQRLQSDYAQAYLPLATLTIGLTAATDETATAGDDSGGPQPPATYRRSLDLSSGLHVVSQESAERRVVHSSVVSAPDGVLAHVIDGLDGAQRDDDETRVTLSLRSPLMTLPTLERDALAAPDGWQQSVLLVRAPRDVAPTHEPAFAAATWTDREGDSVEAAVVVRARSRSGRVVVFAATETTAEIPASGGGMRLRGTVAQAAARASARLDEAVRLGADAVLERAQDDHRSLLGRMHLELGYASDRAKPLDTAGRLREAYDAPDGPLASDPGLVALLVNYGRYLLVASSRPGGLPATLQGIWNDSMQPPWSSAYTLNINLQMNYWAAESANLTETAAPLLRFIEALSIGGAQDTARRLAASGWAAHHNSDAWAYSSPVGAGHGDPSWAFWPMAGPWLVRHLWEHELFGGADPDFLRATAWPVIRGAAHFAAGWMHERRDGSWETSPSTSPENTFRGTDGEVASLSSSTELDTQLLRDVFRITLHAAERLGIGVDDDDIVGLAAARAVVLPSEPRITADGTIAEWSIDAPAVDAHHRHVSPLYAVFPGDERASDAVSVAAAEFLERRGDDSSGWSLAWKAALWARLKRPDKVSDLLALLFRDAGDATGPWSGGLYPNLFTAHPPFQIDGNLGFIAAVVEALLQSHAGIIDVLPAVPAELASGRVSGLIARPGIVVDIDWRHGDLVAIELRARHDRVPVEHTVSYRGTRRTVRLSPHHSIRLTAHDFTESGTTR